MPSVLLRGVQGPILFLLYTADLLKLITTSGLHPHIYTNDMQIYGFCAPTATQALLDQVAACISDVSSWKKSNRLQLNADKTESLWCVPAHHQHLIPSSPLYVCSDNIVPSKHVRDLGLYIDSDMSMRTHVLRNMSSCFAALCQIKSIQHSVSQPVSLSLVSSLVLSILYGNLSRALSNAVQHGIVRSLIFELNAKK